MRKNLENMKMIRHVKTLETAAIQFNDLCTIIAYTCMLFPKCTCVLSINLTHINSPTPFLLNDLDQKGPNCLALMSVPVRW